MHSTRIGIFVCLFALLAISPDVPGPRPAAAAPDFLRAVHFGTGGEVSVAFDRPVVEPEAIGSHAPLLMDFPGSARWTGVARAIFTPERPLPPSRAFEARVDEVRALDGARLAAPVRWTVRTPGLSVSSYLPSETGRRPRFEVGFDRKVDPAELARHSKFISRRHDVAARAAGALIEPVRPLPLDSAWTLVIEPGLKALDGTELEHAWSHAFRICAPQALETVSAHTDVFGANRICLRFRNPVTEKELRARLNLQPKIDYALSVYGSAATLYGDFAPGASLWVRIADGLSDVYGTTMGPAVCTVAMPAYEPTLAFLEHRGGFMERFGILKTPLMAVNVPSATITLTRWSALPWEKQEGEVILREGIAANRVPDEIFTHGIALPGAGEYTVEAEATEQNLREIAHHRVTDLAPSLKLGADRSLACVTSLDTAEPREGVELSLHGIHGRELWRGRSGPDGCASVPGLSALAASPSYLVARGYDDVAWIDLGSTRVGRWRLPVASAPPEEAGRPEIFLFTERPLYRSGEAVEAKGWWKAAREGSIRVELRDWRGDLLEAAARPVSAAGGFDATFRLPGAASAGSYRVVARVGVHQEEHRFEVGAYRAPSFEVTLRPRSPHAVAKERLEASVEARTFFGAPLAGARVEWSTSIEDSEERAEGKGFLDAEGRFEIASRLGGAAGLLTLWASVTDAAHQTISASSSLPVHAAALKLTAQARDSRGEAGKPLGVSIAVQSLDGKPVEREVSLRFLRRTWSSVQQLVAGRGWSYVWEKQDRVLVTAIQTSGAWEGTPSEPGPHVVELSVKDDAGREAKAELHLDVTGPGEASWAPREDLLVDLVPDRPLYKAGESARVLLRGVPHGSRALVTLEREGVQEHRWVEIEDRHAVLEVPLTAAHSPNVHLGVMLLRGRTGYDLGADDEDRGRPRFMYGYATLHLDTSGLRLPVDVRASGNFRPGGEVSLEVRTAPEAEVTLAVVDEAVLSLVGSENPDPHAFFHAARPLRVETSEARPDLALNRPMDVRGKKGRPGGGGGDGKEGGGPRKRFVGTAYWNPLVIADGQGLARVTFRLPDNLTRWRAIAVAAAPGRWGTGTATFRSEKPLMLVSALPRFALLGDAFTGRVLVHNRSGAAGRVRVEIDGTAREVEVAEGRPTPVDFPVSADRLGSRTFRFRATLGAHEDGLEITLPVRFPGATETVVVSGKIERAGTVEPPPLARVESSRLTVAGSELALIEAELRSLLEYPNGCVEQTTSKLLPLLTLRDLGIEGTEDKIARGVERLLSMQTGPGGLAYWPGSDEPTFPGTVYALHALLLASKTGVAVSPAALGRALAWMESGVRTAVGPSKSYGIFVLALAGKPVEPWLESLPPDPFLALAALERSRPDRARQILHAPQPVSSVSAGEFHSPLRARAAAFIARLRLGFPSEVRPAALLAESRLTYERAWTLLAVRESLRAQEEGAGAEVRISSGGRLLEKRPLRGVMRFDVPPGPVTIESEGTVHYALTVKGSREERGPQDKGFWVRTTYVRAGETAPRSDFKAGDLVVVRTIMATRATRSYVAVECPLPAGLEPVDVRFRTEDTRLAEPHRFDYVEQRDDRVFASDVLFSPGVREFVTLARATTAGRFAAPAPVAEEMYEPEVRGRGATVVITVEPR